MPNHSWSRTIGSLLAVAVLSLAFGLHLATSSATVEAMEQLEATAE
jgi:hypothetical protein